MGVVSNNWFDCFTLDYLHVQTLMLTDDQTPFLGTPLAPLDMLLFPVSRRSILFFRQRYVGAFLRRLSSSIVFDQRIDACGVARCTALRRACTALRRVAVDLVHV